VAEVSIDSLNRVNKDINFIARCDMPLAQKLLAILLHLELPRMDFDLRSPHPYGVIVNLGAKLARNVTLYQGVTIGGKRTGRRSGVPTLEESVVVYPNAVVIGSVRIGAGAVIGPGAVVHKDVPAGATVVGNPARIVQ
jgi:serine O-acetyltransferase